MNVKNLSDTGEHGGDVGRRGRETVDTSREQNCQAHLPTRKTCAAESSADIVIAWFGTKSLEFHGGH